MEREGSNGRRTEGEMFKLLCEDVSARKGEETHVP
jgi:hypothetical protein